MALGLGLLNSFAGSTTAQHQQTPRFKPCETGRKVERSEPFEKRLDLMSVWGGLVAPPYDKTLPIQVL